ncbi:MAG: hypothetical protein VZS44_05140 [Bacilli bacterium]|nr:hypothetical protein [Bacilli bacterium]
MDLELKKIFRKDGKTFIVIAITEKNGKKYAFSNRIEYEKEEVTDEYNVFTIENGEYAYVNDKELINELLPTFQKQIKEQLEEIMKENNE